jgi:hypothetical protein
VNTVATGPHPAGVTDVRATNLAVVLRHVRTAGPAAELAAVAIDLGGRRVLRWRRSFPTPAGARVHYAPLAPWLLPAIARKSPRTDARPGQSPARGVHHRTRDGCARRRCRRARLDRPAGLTFPRTAQPSV